MCVSDYPLIKTILFNCPGGRGHYHPLAMPPLFCKKPFHQAGHAYAYAGITRQCTASLLQYTHCVQQPPLINLAPSLPELFLLREIQGNVRMIFNVDINFR